MKLIRTHYFDNKKQSVEAYIPVVQGYYINPWWNSCYTAHKLIFHIGGCVTFTNAYAVTKLDSMVEDIIPIGSAL